MSTTSSIGIGVGSGSREDGGVLGKGSSGCNDGSEDVGSVRVTVVVVVDILEGAERRRFGIPVD